jgi:hypothetical protein
MKSGVFSKGVSELFGANLRRNVEAFRSMNSKKLLAYHEHLKFLQPNFLSQDPESVALAISEISSRNLWQLHQSCVTNDSSPKTRFNSDLTHEELGLIERIVEKMMLGFSHSVYSGVDQEEVIGSGRIFSRRALEDQGAELTGLMKKSGDGAYHYDRFAFGRCVAATEDCGLAKFSDSGFVVPIVDDKSSELCMFLQDWHATSFSGRDGAEDDKKRLTDRVTRVIKSDGLAIKLVLNDEKSGEKFFTSPMKVEEQFFFGKDVPSAMALLAVPYARACGMDYFATDEKLCTNVMDILGFELRLPDSVSLNGAYYKGSKLSLEDKVTGVITQSAKDKMIIKKLEEQAHKYQGGIE